MVDLSFIIPCFRDVKNIGFLMESISKRKANVNKSLTYELIVILDDYSREEIKFIEKYRKIIKNIKVIISSRRIGRTESNKIAMKNIDGEYVIFLSSTDVLRHDFFDSIIEPISIHKPELIEFKSSFEGILNWNLPTRSETKNIQNIKNNPQLITRIYPYEANKIWKTEFIKNKIKNFHSSFNSRFSIEWIYFLVPHVEKFIFINRTLITSIVQQNRGFAAMPIMRFWDFILEYYEENFPELRQEIFYSYLYHTCIFLFLFTSGTKNTILINKHISFLMKKSSKIRIERKTNYYLNFNTKEANVLNQLPTKTRYLSIAKGAM